MPSSLQKAPDPLTVLRVHRADVQALAFHPLTGFLYTGDAQGEIRVWSTETWRSLQTVRLHTNHAGVLHLVCYAVDSVYLLSQGRDGELKNWKLSSDGLLSELPELTIETGSYNFCRVSVWNRTPGCKKAIQETPDTDVSYIANGEDNSLAVDSGRAMGIVPRPVQHSEPSPSPESDFLVRNGSSDSPKHSFTRSNEARVRMVGFACEGPITSEVASAGHPVGALSAALRSTQAISQEKVQMQPAATANSVSLAGLSGEEGSAVELWDLQSGQLRLRWSQSEGIMHCGMAMAVQLFSRPGAGHEELLFAVVGYEDGTLAVWNEHNLSRPLAMCPHMHSEPVMAIALDAQAAGGMSGAADALLKIWRLDFEDPKIEVLCSMPRKEEGIGDVAVRRDGRVCGAGGWDGGVRLYHYKKHKALAVLKYHKAAVTCLCWDNTSNLLASAARDSTVAIWDVYADQ